MALTTYDIATKADGHKDIYSVVREINVNTKLDGLDDLSTAEIAILDGATVTTAELNKSDLSAETETIDSGVAINPAIRVTLIDNTITGADAVTLDVPDASMLGVVKVIEMTVDGGDVTLALTNVQGQSSGTTATFGDVGDTLVLVGGVSKWNVIGEAGIALA